MEQKEFTIFSGTIHWKCPLEHFSGSQWLYGNPYAYVIEYSDHEGGTPERRYALWKFNVETLKYDLYQTADEKSERTLNAIADQWLKELWAEKRKEQGYD
jgi:spore coat protein U-like protein